MAADPWGIRGHRHVRARRSSAACPATPIRRPSCSAMAIRSSVVGCEPNQKCDQPAGCRSASAGPAAAASLSNAAGSRVASQRGDVRPGLDQPGQPVVDGAGQQGRDRDQRQRPAGRRSGRASRPAPPRISGRTSPSSPIPSVVPSAASTDPTSTSSWRACPSSWATIDEDLGARQVVDDVVVERRPAACSRSPTRRR